MIDKETIQRITDATRIEEVVGEFVSLKKRGANYVGCCPFHTEKTPSFSVSPSKGFFKCFGCGESGNAVGFLMKHEHYTYPEALQYLAKKYNIAIVEEEVSEEQRRKDTERDALFHVSEYAQKYFTEVLYENEMGKAVGLSYFHARGLNDEVIRKFGLGYCLDEWQNFSDKARREGYSDTVLEKTGLTIFKEDGKYYDRFRGRVMFPIYSISGRVLGFSGRILSKEKQAAKYVNSPDSEIYNKGRILYGLYQAKTAIIKQDKCYLVEGNVDVVSMHQSGIENTVASCGTSLTYEQIRLIKRYTQNVTILYDGDAAGIKASQRAINMLYEEGMKVRLVLFPDQEDPDSYAQKYGSTQLQQYLKEHEENFILYKVHVLQDDVQSDPIRKGAFVRELVETLALIPDLLERTSYVTQCSSMLDIPEESLMSELAKTMLRNKVKGTKTDGNGADQPSGTEPSGENPPAEEPGRVELPPVGYQHHNTGLPQSGLQFCEAQLMVHLLNYGSQNIYPEWIDENQKRQTHTVPVARFIVDQVRGDNLKFSNAKDQQIFDVFATSEEIPGCGYFTAHPDEDLRSHAIAYMRDDYVVSPMWKEKYSIFVPTIDHNLTQSVQDAVNAFKMANIDRMLAENLQQIAQATDEEARLDRIYERKQYLEIRQKIAALLNRVVS